MNRKNRNSIASCLKLPQFITMNVIDGQAGLVRYYSLIFYSLTINNILNIIILLILAGIAISVLTGENGLFARAKTSTVKYNEESAKEKANMLMSEFVIDNTTQGITLEEFLNEKKKAGDIYDVIDNQDGTMTIEMDNFEVLIDSTKAEVIDVVDIKTNSREESKNIPNFEIAAKIRVGKIVVDHKKTDFDVSNIVKYEVYVGKKKVGETNSLPYNIIGEQDKTYSNIKVIAIDKNNEIKPSSNTLNVTMYHDIVSLAINNLRDKDLLIEIFSDKSSMEQIANNSEAMSAICESQEARNVLYDAHEVTEEVLANSNTAITAMKSSSRCETKHMDLGQVFRHIFLRIFINYSSFAGAVDINIKENL